MPHQIIEKQNRLQMSQIFSVSVHQHQMALLFKDSKSGTEEPNGSGFPNQLSMDVQIKNPNPVGCARGFVPNLNFNKFRSRKSEAALPSRRRSKRDLSTDYTLAGLRRPRSL